MILSRFAWYRRLRGGYWAQVTAPLGILSRTRWVRCKAAQPTPDNHWVFYPWGTKTLGNGYIDEWHFVEPWYAVPFSDWLEKTIGTNLVSLWEEFHDQWSDEKETGTGFIPKPAFSDFIAWLARKTPAVHSDPNNQE
jgi:hypothetical protein